MIRPGERLLCWAGLPFPERFSQGHFQLTGATSSGKTNLIRILIQGVLAEIKPKSNCRAVIFDPKRNALQLIAGMKTTCPVKNMNPFAVGCWAWDMAQDVNDPTVAYEMASILVKEEKGTNPFFAQAARDLCAGVIQALFMTRPNAWSFADVILTLSSKEKAERLLRSVPATNPIAEEHYNREQKTVDSIHMTLTANFGPLRCIAALNATAKHKVSLKDWIESESILVLGHDPERRTPLATYNALILNRIMELILTQDDSDSRRTWVVLDELQALLKVDLLAEFLDMSRSKGTRCVIGFPTIEAIHDIYGEKRGDRILAICSNKTFLRTDSDKTAAWCSRILGKAHVRQFSQSVSTGRGEETTNVTEQDKSIEVVTPSQLMRLKQCTRRRLYAYFTSPDLGVFGGGPIYFARALCPISKTPKYEERPVEEQYLQPGYSHGSGNGKPKLKLKDFPRMSRAYFLEKHNDDQEPSDSS